MKSLGWSRNKMQRIPLRQRRLDAVCKVDEQRCEIYLAISEQWAGKNRRKNSKFRHRRMKSQKVRSRIFEHDSTISKELRTMDLVSCIRSDIGHRPWGVQQTTTVEVGEDPLRFRHVDADLVCQVFAFFLLGITSADERQKRLRREMCHTCCEMNFWRRRITAEESGKMPNNEKLSKGKTFFTLKLPSSAENVFPVATFGSC